MHGCIIISSVRYLYFDFHHCCVYIFLLFISVVLPCALMFPHWLLQLYGLTTNFTLVNLFLDLKLFFEMYIVLSYWWIFLFWWEGFITIFFSKFQHRLFTLRIITCIAKHIADVYISSKSDIFFLTTVREEDWNA